MTQQTAVAALFPEVVTKPNATRYQPPALPDAPTTKAMATMAQDVVANAVPLDANATPFTCWTHLPPEEQEEARRQAKKLVDTAIGDPEHGIVPNSNAVRYYGNETLEPVNDLVRQLLATEGEVEMPELERYMKDIKSRVRAIEGRYSANDPRVKDWYDKWYGKLMAKIHLIQGSWELFREDVKSFDDHVADLEKMLSKALIEIDEIVAKKDIFYTRSEEENRKLFRTIAVLEFAAQDAATRASQVVIDDQDPLKGQRQRASAISEVASELQARVARYQGRLAAGFGTSFDLRNSRSLDAALGTFMSDLIYMTIPTIRSAIWRLMVAKKAAGYARKSELVIGLEAEATRIANQTAVESAGVIATVVNRPFQGPTEFIATAQAMNQVCEIISKALAAGAEASLQNRKAITQALGMLDGSTDQITAARIKAVLDSMAATDVNAVIPPDFARTVLTDTKVPVTPAGA
jgi:hypothetical protein